MKLRLEIEPIPGSTWGISLSNLLPREEWDEIRQTCYNLAGYKCQICGDFNTKLNCHEVWGFKERERIQFLVKVECLCKACHDCKHFGRSREVYPKDYVKELEDHWCKVNKATLEDLRIYESKIYTLNKKRFGRVYAVKVGRRFIG